MAMSSAGTLMEQRAGRLVSSEFEQMARNSALPLNDEGGCAVLQQNWQVYNVDLIKILLSNNMIVEHLFQVSVLGQ